MRTVRDLTLLILTLILVSSPRLTMRAEPVRSTVNEATKVPPLVGVKPAALLRLSPEASTKEETLSPTTFASQGEVGWSILLHLRSLKVIPGSSLLSLTNKAGTKWLEVNVTSAAGETSIAFLLLTDYNPEPLMVRVPTKLLDSTKSTDLLLRYEGYRLDLFYDGVLVDQEWPAGQVQIGSSPEIRISTPTSRVSIWNSPLPDSNIALMNGGVAAVASQADKILGPEPQRIQYSRPRGFNTHAGDAMPFYHDGTFHLFFLLDRRQHHSKWRLGAHQWAHIASTDLIHWKHYPLALSIEHEWEGSICTGSVFFHKGKYFAYYATRLPDRSERLGVAESTDGIHFRKTIPTPFVEPAVPFIHGPNRDPFVFQANKQFHMIVTAALANGLVPNEGALEHLVSSDLSSWSVDREPFITSGSQAQPECSDLFKWGDWYYLLFSLSGTTHYRMSKSPLGPWIEPKSDILDGPEAFVMKASEFHGDRRLLVGFLQDDNQYGGDLVFRELLREPDGTLGTTIPKEMQLPTKGMRAPQSMSLSHEDQSGRSIDIGKDARVSAKILSKDQSTFTIHIGSEGGDSLVFDPGAGTVQWADSMGKSARARLEHVADLSGQSSITLTLYKTVADLSINGHRTLIHRLSSSNHQRIYFTCKGGDIELSQLVVASL